MCRHTHKMAQSLVPHLRTVLNSVLPAFAPHKVSLTVNVLSVNVSLQMLTTGIIVPGAMRSVRLGAFGEGPCGAGPFTRGPISTT